LVPALGRFRSIAPDVELDITLTDRVVDLVEEGFDAAFRIGALADSRMIARQLTPYRMVACASPDYLERMGNPGHPGELESHEAVVFTPSARGPWKFARGTEEVRVSPRRGLSVNSGQAVRVAALAGLGVILQPEILLRQDIAAGRLVQVLPEWQLGERPMWLLFQRDRRMPPRLRSFIAFATETFGPDEDSSEL
jgi:DNA-binding transcriptional LysR family regulator